MNISHSNYPKYHSYTSLHWTYWSHWYCIHSCSNSDWVYLWSFQISSVLNNRQADRNDGSDYQRYASGLHLGAHFYFTCVCNVHPEVYSFFLVKFGCALLRRLDEALVCV